MNIIELAYAFVKYIIAKKYVRGGVPNVPEKNLRKIASRLGWNYAWFIDGAGQQYARKQEPGGDELLNINTIKTIVEALEECVAQEGGRPEPVVYAKLIAYLYEETVKGPGGTESPVDPEAVRRAFRLVT